MNALLKLAACPILSLEPHETATLSLLHIKTVIDDRKRRLLARGANRAHIDDCETWLVAYDLDKRMRAALAKAARGLNESCDMFVNDGGADEEDVEDMRDVARECAALADEGVK